MMKRLLIVLILLFVVSSPAWASSSIIFWYPGEAGSTMEAQPILDEFMDYLKSKNSSLNLKAKYFNTNNEGLNFINQAKPELGIVSYAAWERYKDKFPNAKVWLATNPLPSGKKTESYALVGKKSPYAGQLTAYSSEPMTKEFIRSNLGFTQNITPTQTSQILYVMKQIASGKKQGLAILTPMETNVFKRMKAPWVKSLKIIAISKAVPTARVILFSPPSSNTQELKKILLGIRNDPAAQEILKELRLVGFSAP